jgi:hypothetical protein
VLSVAALEDLPLLHERILDITSERLFHEQCAIFALSDERPRENYAVGQYVMLMYNNHDNNQTSPIQYRLIGPFQIETIIDEIYTVRSTADSSVSEVPVYRLVPFTHASSIAESSLILATELGEDCVIGVAPDPNSNNFRVRWLMAPPSIEPLASVHLTASFIAMEESDSDLTDNSAHGYCRDDPIDVEFIPPTDLPATQPPESERSTQN